MKTEPTLFDIEEIEKKLKELEKYQELGVDYEEVKDED